MICCNTAVIFMCATLFVLVSSQRSHSNYACSSKGGRCQSRWSRCTNGVKIGYLCRGWWTTCCIVRKQTNSGLTVSQARKQIAQNAYNKALSNSISKCGEYVRKAVESALGVKMTRHNSAKDYGPSYLAIGFKLIAMYRTGQKVNEGQLLPGDVLILNSVGDHIHGHAEVYTGRSGKGKYCSDFKQKTPYPWWPHGGIAVYRYYGK